MKTVFKNHQEVCHKWASRSQDEGRSGNISFKGDQIYSYGWWPMARFYGEDVVFIRDASYSNSTSSHQSLMSCAIPAHYKRIRIASLDLDHKANIENFQLNAKVIADSFWASITRADCDKARYDLNAENAKEYCEMFDLTLPPLFGLELSGPKAKAKIEQQEQVHTEKMRQWNLDEQAFYAENKPKLEKLKKQWLDGETNRTGISDGKGYCVYFDAVLLRLTKDKKEVQTSMGAYIPVREGKLLYKALQRGDSVHGRTIGSYTIIGYNGSLKVGCHEITKAEIDRFAKSMNW